MTTVFQYALSATLSGLGANAKLQATKFAVSFAVGAAVGIVALLYFRKAGKAEEFVTDLFATLCLGGGYVVCLEVFFGGKFELYGLVAYLFGTSVLPLVFKTVKKLSDSRKKSAERKQL